MNRRALHFVFKVGNRPCSTDFYRKILGMKVKIFLCIFWAHNLSTVNKNLSKNNNFVTNIIFFLGARIRNQCTRHVCNTFNILFHMSQYRAMDLFVILVVIMMMGYWETRLSRDEAGRRALTSCTYMCTDRLTVIVVRPCHCMIDLVKRVRQGACMWQDQSVYSWPADKTHVWTNNKRLEAIRCVVSLTLLRDRPPFNELFNCDVICIEIDWIFKATHFAWPLATVIVSTTYLPVSLHL